MVEVLATLLITALLLTTLGYVYVRGAESSLSLQKRAVGLEKDALLFWRFTRSVFGAKTLILKNSTELYLITTGGNFFKGLVWEAYLFKNGTLYYYEYPLPLSKIDEIPEGALSYPLRRFKSFSFTSWDRGKRFDSFRGLPDKVEVNADGERYMFSTY